MDFVVTGATRPDFPRPIGRTLSHAELEPADVLLSRGEGLLSDTIASSDGGSYSHAALWTGESIIEARLDGVRERAVDFARDVYRFQWVNVPTSGQAAPAEATGLDRTSAERIVEVARTKLGGAYCTHELYLLGSLFALRLIPSRSLLRSALDLLGGDTADELERLLTQHSFQSMPVICTELVALAYYEASADRRYALHVLSRAARPPHPRQQIRTGGDVLGSEAEARSIARVQSRCQELLVGQGLELRDEPTNLHVALAAQSSQSEADAVPGARVGKRKVLWGSLALAADTGVKLGVVTPADLQFSPSLRFIGRVEPAAG